MGNEVLFVQAAKVKNNLVDSQEALGYIRLECIDSAKEKLENDIDHDTMYLAEYIRHFPDGELAKELAERKPDLLVVIKSKKVDWSKKYVVKACDGIGDDE